MSLPVLEKPRCVVPVASPGLGDAPSLVRTPHNSFRGTDCPDARWIGGRCQEHGQGRWVMVPCKRRRCEVCGAISRWRVAERIAFGCRVSSPASWIVLTFRKNVEKGLAVRRMARFVRWLRVKRSMPDLAYAATYEVTKAGRLHINLLCAPWQFVPQRQLERAWGSRLWVERVKDEGSVGNETAKATPESLGGYLMKLEQVVKEGRRVSFSRNWPKMPSLDPGEPNVKVKWRPLGDSDICYLQNMIDTGWVVEIRPGRWACAPNLRDGPLCGCFGDT